VGRRADWLGGVGTSTPKKRQLADRLEGLAHALLDGMGSPDKIGAATLQQLAISLGIVIDKMLLLRARPFGENNHQSGPSRGQKGQVEVCKIMLSTGRPTAGRRNR
jgi:hypothetical protein